MWGTQQRGQEVSPPGVSHTVKTPSLSLHSPTLVLFCWSSSFRPQASISQVADPSSRHWGHRRVRALGISHCQDKLRAQLQAPATTWLLAVSGCPAPGCTQINPLTALPDRGWWMLLWSGIQSAFHFQTLRYRFGRKSICLWSQDGPWFEF